MFEEPDKLFIAIIFLIVGIFFYLIPTIVSDKKKDHNSIFWLNLLAGWTFFGWVGALIWAISSPKKEQEWHYECPKCGFRNTLNQAVKIYVCPQCKKETPIDEFENNKNDSHHPVKKLN